MMKIFIRQIILFLFITCSFRVAAQTQVTPFNPGITAEGVNYTLPKTVLHIEVQAMREVYTPGEFAKYADRYLHFTGVSQEPSVKWTQTKFDVWQEGVPDTLKCFTVKLKDKTVAPMVQLTKSGLIVSVNHDVDVKEHEDFVGTQTSNKRDARQYLTEDILSATSKSKMAELVAQEILDIRDSKNAIKRGQADTMPKDGASLKILLDELNAQELALTQMFTGYVDTIIVSKKYELMPESDISNQVLFRFSQKLGFVDADDLAGEPYTISLSDQHTVALPAEKDAAKRKIQGLVYNMPSMARVQISSPSSLLYDQQLPFAQFGTIDVLAPALFNKGATTKVTFCTSTGGLLHLEQ